MAKPAKKTQKPTAPEDGAAKLKSGSGRSLLLAAMLLSVASLGGGFFLARMAFQQDASNFEPEYVAETSAAASEPTQAKSSGVIDPLATEGHPASDALALTASEDKSEAGAAETMLEGMMEFDEIVANIQSYNAQGVATKAFLKVNVVLVYRPVAGATEVLTARKAFMRDLFVGYIRSLSESDVRGMAGIINVKAELLKRARAASGSDLPQEILISDLIVQ